MHHLARVYWRVRCACHTYTLYSVWPISVLEQGQHTHTLGQSAVCTPRIGVHEAELAQWHVGEACLAIRLAALARLILCATTAYPTVIYLKWLHLTPWQMTCLENALRSSMHRAMIYYPVKGTDGPKKSIHTRRGCGMWRKTAPLVETYTSLFRIRQTSFMAQSVHIDMPCHAAAASMALEAFFKIELHDKTPSVCCSHAQCIANPIALLDAME